MEKGFKNVCFLLFFIWTQNIDLVRLYLDSVQEVGMTDRTKADGVSFYSGWFPSLASIASS